MEKCSCWNTKSVVTKWRNGTPIDVETVQYCNGTKEQEVCSCGGDVSKCDFYPEKRGEKKLKTLEMMIQAQKDGKTYKYGDLRYNTNFGFHDSKGFAWWEGYVFEYINDIFNICDWKVKPDNEMTKSEAEAKFNIKIMGD